jgi:hypothetical protein
VNHVLSLLILGSRTHIVSGGFQIVVSVCVLLDKGSFSRNSVRKIRDFPIVFFCGLSHGNSASRPQALPKNPIVITQENHMKISDCPITATREAVSPRGADKNSRYHKNHLAAHLPSSHPIPIPIHPSKAPPSTDSASSSTPSARPHTHVSPPCNWHSSAPSSPRPRRSPIWGCISHPSCRRAPWQICPLAQI